MKRSFLILLCLILVGASILFPVYAVDDKTAPAVTVTSPENKAYGVGIDTAITVKFDENLLKGIYFSVISLVGEGNKKVSSTVTIINDTLIIKPKANLDYATTYTLIIPLKAVKDSSGNLFAGQYTLSFRTEGRWEVMTEENVHLMKELNTTMFGIKEITPNGSPCHVNNENADAIVVVAGDDNTTFPNSYAVATMYNKGRVMAIGHEGIIQDGNIKLLDNAKFIMSTIYWLNSNGAGKKRVAYTSGHKEYLGDWNLKDFQSELKKKEYTLNKIDSIVSEKVLANVDILIVGNAWADFTEDEKADICKFVEDGGSLLLFGLGWSFTSYNKPKTIDEYPMNRLANEFGIDFTETTISDFDDSYSNYPIFHTFLENIKKIEREDDMTLREAMITINEAAKKYPDSLEKMLESDKELLNKCLNANMTLVNQIYKYDASSDEKKEVYKFCREMALRYPKYFSREYTFDVNLYPNISLIKERFFVTWIDSSELTAQTKKEISQTGMFKGTYKEIWDKYSIYIADNNKLKQPELSYLSNMLSLIPSELHNVRVISFDRLLMKNAFDPDITSFYVAQISYTYLDSNKLNLAGHGGWVNSFISKLGVYKDYSSLNYEEHNKADLFSLELTHQINHCIEWFTIQHDERLGKRQKHLLKDAGYNENNYFFRRGDRYFINYPSELFASLSNFWFTDSENTIAQGLQYFDAGSINQINQVLFFADVYSMEGNSTYFYKMDVTKNSLARTAIPVERDSEGRLIGLTYNGKEYTFTLDVNGNVSAYKVE